MSKKEKYTSEILSSKQVFKGRGIELDEEEVLLLPKGSKTRVFRTKTDGEAKFVLSHFEPIGSVGIVPVLDDGGVVLIRQYRLAPGSTILEIPAGTVKRGERPEECAKRELEEEGGYRAGHLRPLFDCYLAPGYSSEVMRIFLATSLVRTRQIVEEDELISVRIFRPEAVLRAISSGTTDAKTMASVAYLVANGELAKRRA